MTYASKKEHLLMKSALCSNPKTFELTNEMIKSPEKNQALVRLEGCGVCGSNLPVWDGRSWFEYPLEPGAPGHEGWGTIEALGESVEEFSVGNRVAVLSSHAFAQFETVSTKHLVKLPPELDALPFPGEPLGCAMNVFKRSNILPGQTVAIIGVGFLGSLLIQLAVRCGAKVIAISRRRFSLDLARGYGAYACLELSSGDVVNEVKRITDYNGCDCVIEAAGYQQSLDIASEIIKNYGRLIIAGYHQDGIRTVNLQQWNWKGIDVINAHERDHGKYLQGIEDAIAAIIKKEIDCLPLFTHVYPIEQINTAFEMLKNRPDGFVKALVTI
jgi:threonine dehydrogenase-like Zn-dependent dehydrogenase